MCKGFSFRKCQNSVAGKGDRWEDRRCLKCGYNESPTANTVFHSIKFPLVTAFEMAYRISVSKKGISGLALSREYHLNPKTAYHFRQKIQECMNSNGDAPLEGIVHVDEFVIGGPESGCQGRSAQSRKKRIVTAVEVLKKKGSSKLLMGKAYAVCIEDFSSQEIGKIFKGHISPKAKVKTDCWSGYVPLKKDFNIKQLPSNKGANFPTIHALIMNVKSWVRGIHHSVSSNYIQKYLDEFFYRFNNRNLIFMMPELVLSRIQQTNKCPVRKTKGGYYG